MRFLNELKAKYVWSAVKEFSRPGKPKWQSMIAGKALGSSELLPLMIDNIFQMNRLESKVDELAKVCSAILAFKDQVDISEKAFRLAVLADWVLMFRMTYNLPFSEWSDIAGECVDFLQKQWTRGPMTFQAFYDGGHPLIEKLDDRKQKLRTNATYQKEFLKTDI